jgi:hypothetical protein
MQDAAPSTALRPYFDLSGRCKMQDDERDLLEIRIFDEIEETVGTWLRGIIQRLEKQQADSGGPGGGSPTSFDLRVHFSDVPFAVGDDNSVRRELKQGAKPFLTSSQSLLSLFAVGNIVVDFEDC